MYNLVSGRIFPQNCNKLFEVTNQGNILYDKFITERLQEGSNIEILARLKKVNAPIFKKAGKTKRVNANGEVHERKDCIDLFAKYLIVSSRCDIDMPKIVREFELSTVTRSFMKADGEYNHGRENKEHIVHTICKVVPKSILDQTNDFTVLVIDAMQVVQKLIKPENVTTFTHLADVFIEKI